MTRHNAESDRRPEVLHVDTELANLQSLQQTDDMIGELVEGICELIWIRPPTVARAEIVGRDDMVAG